jgi:hypothetical protein
MLRRVARMVIEPRTRRRWGPRLRTAGALLSLAGAVGMIDRLLPRARDPITDLPPQAQWIAAACAIFIGGCLFTLGRRWR